jgi:dienelactone hydrolase
LSAWDFFSACEPHTDAAAAAAAGVCAAGEVQWRICTAHQDLRTILNYWGQCEQRKRAQRRQPICTNYLGGKLHPPAQKRRAFFIICSENI